MARTKTAKELGVSAPFARHAMAYVLAGDHIYKMDYEKMLQQHVDSGADVTVGCLEATLEEATAFGVMHVDADNNIFAFLEKPKNPPHMPGKPEVALCSMGIYVFETT